MNKKQQTHSDRNSMKFIQQNKYLKSEEIIRIYKGKGTKGKAAKREA